MPEDNRFKSVIRTILQVEDNLASEIVKAGHTADSLRAGEPSEYHLLIFGIADQISWECYQRFLVSICTFKAPEA
jgi:hypothetical protein